MTKSIAILTDCAGNTANKFERLTKITPPIRCNLYFRKYLFRFLRDFNFEL
jgi:hypothetical protein